ncbi:MAG: methyltransferase family protein [Candidatus Hydrothermarchaeales archaeon]
MSLEHQLGIGKEHQYNHLIQLGSLIVFLTIWGLDSFVFNLSGKFIRPIGIPIRIGLFSITLISGLYLIKASHDAVLDAKESTSTITTGAYAYGRHPMYLGTLLIYVSLIFLTMSLVSFIPFIVIFFLYNMLADYEERDLERILGQEYVEYKKRVARWIPKIY